MNARIVDVAVNPNNFPPDLSICDSDIEGAGKGLFCNKFIMKGSVICEYKGGFVFKDDPRDGLEYGLALGEPHMAALNGELIISVDADPQVNQEIGYAGFANDLYTDYEREIRELEEAKRYFYLPNDLQEKIIPKFKN